MYTIISVYEHVSVWLESSFAQPQKAVALCLKAARIHDPTPRWIIADIMISPCLDNPARHIELVRLNFVPIGAVHSDRPACRFVSCIAQNIARLLREDLALASVESKYLCDTESKAALKSIKVTTNCCYFYINRKLPSGASITLSWQPLFCLNPACQSLKKLEHSSTSRCNSMIVIILYAWHNKSMYLYFE